MKKLLPQANSLDTVIKVFVYACTKKGCTQVDIAEFCSFEPRQAAYYLNACYYLGLVDDKGVVTELGSKILETPSEIKQQVYWLILEDEVIGTVFNYKIIFPEKDARAFTEKFLADAYPEYSEAVIKRRASTLLNWCDEILDSPLISRR